MRRISPSCAVLCRGGEVLGLLEQPPKFRRWSEAHGSIRVQEGHPFIRSRWTAMLHQKVRHRRETGELMLSSRFTA